MDDQSVDLEGSAVRPGASLHASRKRNSILCIFDADYSAQGSMVYSAVRWLIDQVGDGASYEVFCQGPYRGPRLIGAARFTEAQSTHNLPRAFKRIAGGLHRILVRWRISESPSRWASNLQQGEEKLLRRLFDVDNIQAVIVFTTQPGFALRIVRLAHIYSLTETPHLIVVTPNRRIASRTAADLDWLGVHVLRDGDLIVDQKPTPATHGGDDPEVIASSSVYSFLAPEEYPRPFTNPRNQIDWHVWVGLKRRYPKRVHDVVLFVRPDWINCGSGTTFENLARWFRERDSLLIDVGIWPFRENFEPFDRSARVASEQANIRGALYFAARGSTSLIHIIRQIGILCRWFPLSIARQKMLKYSLAAKPRLVRQAILRAKISHIYINHYFTYGYARDFIAGRPFFLDTHDIQTVNFIHHNQRNAITRRADRFAASLRQEMEIAGKAERLCFVSQDELNLAATYLDRTRLDYVLPLPRVVPCPQRSPGILSNLLIVSSNNLSNEQSLNWFFSNVWPIVLRLCEDQSLPMLRVCGGIDAAMAHVKLPGVEFLGVVPQLWRYYNETDLVLLPIISGGGVAIKTLEAVLHERPVLATRHALRGLPHDVARAIGHEDDPIEYARSLLAIIADSTRYHAQSEKSRKAASLLREYSFYRTLGKGVDAVRLSRPDTARERWIDYDRSKPIDS